MREASEGWNGDQPARPFDDLIEKQMALLAERGEVPDTLPDWAGRAAG